MRTPIARIKVVRAALEAILESVGATKGEAASALACVLSDILVMKHAAGDEKARAEMRRMGNRYLLLADTPPEQVVALARELADSETH